MVPRVRHVLCAMLFADRHTTVRLEKTPSGGMRRQPRSRTRIRLLVSCRPSLWEASPLFRRPPLRRSLFSSAGDAIAHAFISPRLHRFSRPRALPRSPFNAADFVALLLYSHCAQTSPRQFLLRRRLYIYSCCFIVAMSSMTCAPASSHFLHPPSRSPFPLTQLPTSSSPCKTSSWPLLCFSPPRSFGTAPRHRKKRHTAER